MKFTDEFHDFFRQTKRHVCAVSRVDFFFSIFVRSLFSTNHALRHDTSFYKPIGKIRCVLGHQRLGERFFFLPFSFSLSSASRFFFFFFSFATWWSQTSEQGRKVAVTNKLILWSTERCLRGCLQAYSLAFLPSFFVALALYPSNVLFLLSSSIPAISNSKGKKKKKKKRKKRKEATGN